MVPMILELKKGQALVGTLSHATPDPLVAIIIALNFRNEKNFLEQNPGARIQESEG